MGKRIGIWALVFLVPWASALVCRGRNEGWSYEEILAEEKEALEETQDEAEAKKAGADGIGSPKKRLDGAEEEQTEQRILIKKGDISTYLSLEDYLPGVLMRQIDTGLHMEALKCQAVIARTYLCRQMNGREEIREEELELGEAPGQPGATRAQREAWAEGLKRCIQAVQETRGVVMTFEGEYVLPLFHRASAGRTRTGEEAYPYLQSVESPWDQEEQELVWSFSEFCELAKKGLQAELLEGAQIAGQMQVAERDAAGYLLEMKLGMGVYSGDQVWYAFSLPSPCVSFFVEQDGVHGLVRGTGHGYGLSQTGADGMAKEGWSWREILQYYYKDVTIWDGGETGIK